MVFVPIRFWKRRTFPFVPIETVTRFLSFTAKNYSNDLSSLNKIGSTYSTVRTPYVDVDSVLCVATQAVFSAPNEISQSKLKSYNQANVTTIRKSSLV